MSKYKRLRKNRLKKMPLLPSRRRLQQKKRQKKKPRLTGEPQERLKEKKLSQIEEQQGKQHSS